MSRLTHEQFDEKVQGLAKTYEALDGLDFRPSSLTGGEVDDRVVYGVPSETTPLGFALSRGVSRALQGLRFDIGCWGQLTHDSSVFVDEATTDERLKMAGVLAMMTAPKDQEMFNEVALTIYELLDNVVHGNNVVVVRPGKRRWNGSEWGDDIQQCGQHDGKIRVTFENGHISSRIISVWSNRPKEIHEESKEKPGHFPQVVFPLLTLDLEALAEGKVSILYPVEQSA